MGTGSVVAGAAFAMIRIFGASIEHCEKTIVVAVVAFEVVLKISGHICELLDSEYVAELSRQCNQHVAGDTGVIANEDRDRLEELEYHRSGLTHLRTFGHRHASRSSGA